MQKITLKIRAKEEFHVTWQFRWFTMTFRSSLLSKLYIPSTLNIDLILWHTQLIVCAENVKSWFKSRAFNFTFQAYILHHTLICICVSLFKFHIGILEQSYCCPKWPVLPRHKKVWVHLNCLEHSICISLLAVCTSQHKKPRS